MIKNKGDKNKRLKVFVGLSGGVDSSVSASLLKEAGFDVSGVFIKVWQPNIALTGGCTWKEDRLDAMRVCAKLDIPFYTLDLEKEYKKEVVDYMIREYKQGRTPNPDVMCNKYVKFVGFFDWAMKRGADYVATGHYARVEKSSQKKTLANGLVLDTALKPIKAVQNIRGPELEFFSANLMAGKDKNKDQSYFLWTLNQKQLAKTLFPIGNLEKPQVRKLAKKFNLNTATKKDSQGICFIGKIEISEFLKNYIKTKKGKVLNEKGEVVGEHEGVELYTLGQRHGFNITKKTNNDGRYFIISKDLKKNILTVASNCTNNVDLNNKELILKDINWTIGQAPDLSKEYFARIRYRQPLEKCLLEKKPDKTWLIKFFRAQIAPTSGQSVVIYDGEVCLGGGIIV